MCGNIFLIGKFQCLRKFIRILVLFSVKNTKSYDVNSVFHIFEVGRIFYLIQLLYNTFFISENTALEVQLIKENTRKVITMTVYIASNKMETYQDAEEIVKKS